MSTTKETRPIDANNLAQRIREYMDDFPNATTRLATCRAILSMLGDETQTPTLRPITREQVEKVWKGEWIKRYKHRGGFRRVKGIDDMGDRHEVTIDERCEYDDLYCPKCGKQSPDNFLNFCGYCGEAFTDKAVDMVMERLEALWDE